MGRRLRRLLRRLIERAPRQLRVTRAGRAVVAIAFVAGLAALNSGNNLLFFGWGMVLSAIVVSGVLSELTLRRLQATPSLNAAHLPLARVDAVGRVALTLHNLSARMPAYGLELKVEMQTDLRPLDVWAPFQLRLPAAAVQAVVAPFTPAARGLVTLRRLMVRTAYPFGFFEKSRRLEIAPTAHFWVAPRAVDVGVLLRALTARLGVAPRPQVGAGDDFFSLRPYRNGDDLRRVAWARSARTGRLMVVENEAVVAREVMLHLSVRLSAGSAAVEHAIATLCSLAEALLQAGYIVAVCSHGLLLPPAAGSRGRQELLLALAKLNPRRPLHRVPPPLRHLKPVALIGEGTQQRAPAGALVVPLAPMERPAPGATAAPLPVDEGA